ncbi:Carboxypeptidase regulatory-like domain-containing protein [Singulisphaera sp. GP187]|uniref:carboxypeptidase-like regulatory domain-containing protein n=1 Tax=Singulisphaera sp. GP187 TaxID=1882752 RepID=UPI000927FE8C|nr:carboxypeptidase-like regulatory domain-containing protein [Singulisphaera sp. GP187]SIO40013.1 Carboxypeptidase regulatory-like domain-containing protein [Singulisphaera sp. GP187]
MRLLAFLSALRLLAIGVVACGIGGPQLRADDSPAKQENSSQRLAGQVEPANAGLRTIEGVVREYGGEPVAGALVVAGFTGLNKPNHHVFKTDENGRFVCPVPEQAVAADFFAHKDGWAPITWRNRLTAEERSDPFARRLHQAEPFSATLIDREGRPIAGAHVRVESFGYSLESMESFRTGTHPNDLNPEVLGGSPLEVLFQTTTDQAGAFTFPASLPKVLLRLSATVAGREFRVRAEKETPDQIPLHMAEAGFVAAPAGNPPRLVAFPAARVAGRVTTTIPGVRVAGLAVTFQNSHPGQGTYRSSNHRKQAVQTGEDGHFTLDGLDEGPINIFIRGEGEGDSWTYRVDRDVALKPGETTEFTLELIRGVEVEGKVLGRPGIFTFNPVQIEVCWPSRSRSGGATYGFMTQDGGHYHYRLPPGKTTFFIMSSMADLRRRFTTGSTRATVTIPEGVTHYHVPPLQEMALPMIMQGRIVNDQGAPVAGVTVVGIGEADARLTTMWPPTVCPVTDASGGFRLPNGWDAMVPFGRTIRLRVRHPDGSEREAVAASRLDGSDLVKFALLTAPR